MRKHQSTINDRTKKLGRREKRRKNNDKLRILCLFLITLTQKHSNLQKPAIKHKSVCNQTVLHKEIDRFISLHLLLSLLLLLLFKRSPSINLTINTKSKKKKRKRRRTLNTPLCVSFHRCRCCCCFSLVFTCEPTQNLICIGTIFHKFFLLFSFSISIHDILYIDYVMNLWQTKQEPSN